MQVWRGSLRCVVRHALQVLLPADRQSPSAHIKASGCLKASKTWVPRADCLTFKQVVGNAEGRGNDILTVYQQKEEKISF